MDISKLNLVSLNAVLFGFLIIAAFGGCSKISRSDFDNRVERDNWDIKSVEYTCAQTDICPASQGVLFWTEPSPTPGKILVSDCTGNAYSEKLILTAGHCADGIAKALSAFFKTVATPGHPSQTVKIARVAQSSFDEKWHYSDDFAALELAEPLRGITQYAYPAKEPPVGNELVALVANWVERDHLKLDAISCTLQNNFFSHAELALNPNFFSVLDCILRHGNSGGSFVQRRDLNAVYGLTSTGYNSEILQQAQAEQNRRLPLSKSINADYEDLGLGDMIRTDDIHPWSNLSNVRCASLPGWKPTTLPCQRLDDYLVRDLRNKNIVLRQRRLMYEVLTEWNLSSLSKFEQGPFRVELEPTLMVIRATVGQFVPDMKEGSKAKPQIIPIKQTGLMILPKPRCIETSGSSPHVYNISLNVKAIRWKPDFISFVTAVDWPNTARVYMAITAAGNGLFNVIYSTQVLRSDLKFEDEGVKATTGLAVPSCEKLQADS